MYTPKSDDAVALASYLDGASRPERVRRLLDAERRGRQWTLALGPEPATEALLAAHATTAVVRRILEHEHAPMMLWTGDDLAA